MDVFLEFGDRLSELMLLKNDVKSEQLGKALGVSGCSVRCWLKGKHQISLPNLLKVADYFGCTMEFLAGRSDNEMKFIPQTPPPFPQALAKVMKERGVTRYWLHKNTKFKDPYLYKWNHGSPPDLTSLIELADFFEITIDYLVGRET